MFSSLEHVSNIPEIQSNIVQYVCLIVQFLTRAQLLTIVQFLTCEEAVTIVGFSGNLVAVIYLFCNFIDFLKEKSYGSFDLHRVENCSTHTSCQLINVVAFGIKIDASIWTHSCF